jgi:hypothetical protein
MNRSDRDDGRLKGRKLQHLVVKHNPGPSGDNNPVLTPVMMKLETKTMTRPNLNELHLVTHTFP